MKGEVFDPVEIEWNGVKYAVPPNKVMGLIAKIEAVEVEDAGATIPELVALSRRRGTIKLSVLAAAWRAVLDYAGATGADGRPLTVDEVYVGLFGGANVAANAQVALFSLVSIMSPPPGSVDASAAAASPKKAKPAARTSSPRKRSS